MALLDEGVARADEAAAPILAARNLEITYVNARTGVETTAVQDCSFQVETGEFVCVLGPSGCGKTTLLQAVAGLVPVTGGELLLRGRPIRRPGSERALVFQAPSLLPWRNVVGNVTYGLELQGCPPKERHERARRFIDLVGLNGFEGYYPRELSGGMQQRVNLARALSCDPELLLLDEPFASLDAQTREYMQLELLKIWEATRKTAVFVTHQIDEAVYLADRVLVMTARPARVKAEYVVDIERPRPLASKRSNPRFLRLVEQIWNEIELGQPPPEKGNPV